MSPFAKLVSLLVAAQVRRRPLTLARVAHVDAVCTHLKVLLIGQRIRNVS